MDGHGDGDGDQMVEYNAFFDIVKSQTAPQKKNNAQRKN